MLNVRLHGRLNRLYSVHRLKMSKNLYSWYFMCKNTDQKYCKKLSRTAVNHFSRGSAISYLSQCNNVGLVDYCLRRRKSLGRHDARRFSVCYWSNLIDNNKAAEWCEPQSPIDRTPITDNWPKSAITARTGNFHFPALRRNSATLFSWESSKCASYSFLPSTEKCRCQQYIVIQNKITRCHGRYLHM